MEAYTLVVASECDGFESPPHIASQLKMLRIVKIYLVSFLCGFKFSLPNITVPPLLPNEVLLYKFR